MILGEHHMNSLLINARLPQLRCVVAGGRLVYGTKISGQCGIDNYQNVMPRVGVIYLWARFKLLAKSRGKS